MSDVQIIIDTREASLQSLVEQEYESKQLEIGDVQIYINGSLFILIERKTIADLAQSVKDNRYKEQKARILSNVNKDVRVIYVIEGNYSYSPSLKYSNMNNCVLTSCIINSIVRDRIQVVNTKSIHDTADFVNGLIERIRKDPNKYIESTADVGYNASSLVSLRKKDNISKTECLSMQLSCIPGISNKKAQAIAHHFKADSIASLVAIITQSESPQKVLESVDGIGKRLAKVVYDYIV